MGLSSVPPVCHPSPTGLSWLFPLALQQTGHIQGSLGQPQRRLRRGWDQQGLWGWTGTAPGQWPCLDPPPEPREAGGDGSSPGCGMRQELGSRAGQQPAPCPPSFPCRGHAWVPGGAPSSPVPTVTLGKQGCRERRGSPLDLHMPAPLQGAAGEPGGALHPPTLDFCGDFNKGLFSCRGSWCYPGRGSPRRRLFPR